MKTKMFNNARFCPKGDVEANWNKTVGFIPLDKEIIIYKPDENHPVARFKVGDGVTFVQDLPFAGTDDKEIKAYIDSKIEAIPIQVQADWGQTNENAKDFIKNKPTIPEGLATETYVNEQIATIKIPIVDQIYEAESKNAQSGVAVAEAILPVIEKKNEQDTKISTIENKIITATKDNVLSIFN